MRTRRSEFEGKTLRQAIELLDKRFGAFTDDRSNGDSPIFLLSAGWRSGSTLVQRLINSDSSTLVWGEPFEDFGVVHRLARTVELFWPDGAHLSHAITEFEGSLSNEWVANLNPGVLPLRRAHRHFFDQLFGAPARERARPRWGCKWVRLTAGHAYYLRWIYPSAKFVFLVRHPVHALSSYEGKRWFYVRPHIRVTRAWQFLDHWSTIAGTFLDEHRALGAMVIRYEDIVSGGTAVDALAEFLGIHIDEGVLHNRIGSRPGPKRFLGPLGRVLLAHQAGRLCDRLGYGRSGGVRPRPTF